MPFKSKLYTVLGLINDSQTEKWCVELTFITSHEIYDANIFFPPSVVRLNMENDSHLRITFVDNNQFLMNILCWGNFHKAFGLENKYISLHHFIPFTRQ